MSSEWTSVTIEQLAAPYPSALATGPFGSSISAKYFTDQGVPVIRGSNLSTDVSQRLNDDGLVFVSHEKAAEFGRSIARRGDLIFTCWGTINQVGIIDNRAVFDEYVVSNKQMKLTVDSSKVNSLFLYYVFSSPEKQREILENGIGSSVPGFNLGQLKKHRINLPPLRVQEKIAQILGTIDERIALLRETRTTLDAIAQALFKSWFIDFDPVRAKKQGQLPEGMDESIAALFVDNFEASELGPIPNGWKIASLDDIARFQNGLALQKFPPEDDAWLPVIKIAQLRKGDTTGADRASRNLKPEYIVKDGDVLFSWSGSLEVEVWCGGEGALNQHLFKVTSDKYPKWFYYLWTKHHLPNFQQIAASKATTMGHIQRKHLTDAKALIPSVSLMNEADSIFQPLLERIISISLKEKTLASIRDALLPRLISDQLRVGELDNLIELGEAP